jgi:hypothetical protein
MDFVSHNLIQELGLRLCIRKKHQYILPKVQAAGFLIPKIYRIYHLKIGIINRYDRSVDFIRPFITIDRSITNTSILLGRSSLQSLVIILDNEIGEWEFKRYMRI